MPKTQTIKQLRKTLKEAIQDRRNSHGVRLDWDTSLGILAALGTLNDDTQVEIKHSAVKCDPERERYHTGYWKGR